MQINNQPQQQNINFGSKKVPRNIYHLTSNANYKSMLADGFISKSGNPNYYIEKGVYALELPNFFKFWGQNKDWGYDDLQRTILRHIVKWINTGDSAKSELVILKIPTAKLDKEKLAVRSLNRLFNFVEANKGLNKASEELQSHLTGNTPAEKAPLFKMRKEAIEYIYKDDIPMEDVEQVGNIVNIASLRKDAKFRDNPVKFIMESLLKGTPESNGVDLIK